MDHETFKAFTDSERFNRVLEGTAYYSFVHSPNMSPTKVTETKKWKGLPYFGVSLGVDKENAKKAESFGLTVLPANDAIPEPHVKITRKIKPDKTIEDCKPDVVDEMQQPIPATVLIGNGSKVLVKFATYWYDNNDGGVGTTFFKMQVKDLVPFIPDNSDPDLVKNEDGFNINDYLAGSDAEDTAPSDETQEPVEVAKETKKKAGGATNPAIFDD